MTTVWIDAVYCSQRFIKQSNYDRSYSGSKRIPALHIYIYIYIYIY